MNAHGPRAAAGLIAMTLTTTWRLAKEAALSWRDDYAPSMGAALAY